MLQKALWEHRPYEMKKGEADRIYRQALADVTAAIERREDPMLVLTKVYEEFMAMAIGERTKPVIGIVGEIYIRANRFGNEDVVGQIERLGGEAWVAPYQRMVPLRERDGEGVGDEEPGLGRSAEGPRDQLSAGAGRAPAHGRVQREPPEPP